MSGFVWDRINRELKRRGTLHLVPSSWADLGKSLPNDDGSPTTSQTMTNWKRRGVPPKHYPAIAAVFGWTIEQLMGADEAPPPKTDPLEPYRKVFAMLGEEDMRAVLAFAYGRLFKGDPEMAKMAAEFALTGTGTPKGRGGLLGGDSQLGDLDEDEAAAGGSR